MTSFSEANFCKKLAELNNSQQSIQTVSHWLIFHRKHSRTSVDVWLKELKKAKPPRRLTFLYLANDVVQNSKKKGPEYSRDFRLVLPDAYKVSVKDADEKTKGSMGRMLNIWQERGVFDPDFIGVLRSALGSDSPATPQPEKLPAKVEKKEPKVEKPPSRTSSSSGFHKASGSNKVSSSLKSKSNNNTSEPPSKKKKKDISLLEEIEREQENGSLTKDIPEPEDLVRSLEDLENSASSDAAVRERIAALPPEVSDVSLLDKLKDKEEAAKLVLQVEEARQLLMDYNSRLAAELEERKRVAIMLHNFIGAQKEALARAEQKLQDHKSKLDKVTHVRQELKSHIQSLPDLTLLPDVTGLAPLPSAGDLFAGQ